MIRFLLDTDDLTLLEMVHPPLLGRLLSWPPEEIAISVITIEFALKTLDFRSIAHSIRR